MRCKRNPKFHRGSFSPRWSSKPNAVRRPVANLQAPNRRPKTFAVLRIVNDGASQRKKMSLGLFHKRYFNFQYLIYLIIYSIL